MFSIANASKTNVMWLESPSLKLKYEFLNWIAISLIDHGGNITTPLLPFIFTFSQKNKL